MNKYNIKFISLRFVFVIIGIAVGLLVMAQMRTVPDRITNPVTPSISLQQTRDLLYSEQKDLTTESEKLRKQNTEIQGKIKTTSKSAAQVNQLEAEKASAGLTEVRGPGVIIEFDDSSNSEISEQAIVHAADLRDIMNLLWSSGAEAISINQQRIVFTTAIDCVVNTILINNTKISNPFTIQTIGDRDRILTALNSPLNLSSIKTRNAHDGLKFNFRAVDNTTIDSYNGTFTLSLE